MVNDEFRFELINGDNSIDIRRYAYDINRLDRSQPHTHQGEGLGI